MIATDIVSTLSSILGLIDFGCKVKGAREEMAIYQTTFRTTKYLICYVRDVIDRQADQIDFKDLAWIHDEIKRCKSILVGAKAVMDKKRAHRSILGCGRLMWVWKDKGTAEAYSAAVHNCHNTLLAVRQMFCHAETRQFILTRSTSTELSQMTTRSLRYSDTSKFPLRGGQRKYFLMLLFPVVLVACVKHHGWH
jgi:hypothetical protein